MISESVLNDSSTENDEKTNATISTTAENQSQKSGCVRHYSPNAFKFYMEQHIENVLYSYKQRITRRNQLESELNRSNLPDTTQQQIRQLLAQKESNHIRLQRAKIDKTMFKKLRTIGSGAFGEVALVQRIDRPHQLFAMKTMRKSNVLKHNQTAHIKAERDIMAEADNEWIVKLYFSFQDNDCLYLVMEYIPGGDLMTLLVRLKIFQEPLAKFYAAELIMAIETVHKMGFIHRDIKPDNILIDQHGHIKLTDFGLCTGFRWTHDSKLYSGNDQSKPVSMTDSKNLAHSVVGTPNYIAPEILECKGYSQSCDWWSTGVILFEMLIGRPPFLAASPVETQQKIINWQSTLKIPVDASISSAASDLIAKLCTSSTERLKCDRIKSHRFFSDVHFETSKMRQTIAPYIPRLKCPTDTSNFENIDNTNSNQPLDNVEVSVDDENMNSPAFIGFTYRRFFTSIEPTKFAESFITN